MSNRNFLEQDKSEQVCILGLGYIGLTLSVALASKGIKVYGTDINDNILKSLENKKSHFWERGLNVILEKVIENGCFSFSNTIPESNNFNSYIITVGTPLDSNGKFTVDKIVNATTEIAKQMNENSLIVLRSTVAIGTTRNIVRPILMKSGKPFDLAMSPERTLEGNALQELFFNPQIIGSDSRIGLKRSADLFKTICDKNVFVSSWEAAEIIKLCDNSYRDLHFAFSNEVSNICSLYGIDCYEVIDNGKFGYPRTNIPSPGFVGGPCLQKDPHIFSQSVLKLGYKTVLIEGSRKINEEQINTTAIRIKHYLISNLKQKLKLLFIGLAFKGVPETDDLRGSTGLIFLEHFTNDKNFTCELYDPVIKPKDLSYFGKVVNINSKKTVDYDAIIFLNNHPSYDKQGLSFFTSKLSLKGFIFDVWRNFISFESDEKYFTLGNLHLLNV